MTSELSAGNRVVLVFGASGGIGAALCRQLHEDGAVVVGSARSRDRLSAIAAGTGATPMPADVTVPGDVDRVVDETVRLHGRLDGIALCVGSILLKPAHLTTDAEWAETLALNLTPAFVVARAAGRTMSRTGGSVVFVSTVAARVGLANHEAIAAAKGGVQALALSAAATYASRGVRFNVVAPGLVDTPLASRITGNEAALKASTAMHPLGRIGRPEDVASAIAWFLHPRQSWVTGQILGVDGGLASVRSR